MGRSSTVSAPGASVQAPPPARGGAAPPPSAASDTTVTAAATTFPTAAAVALPTLPRTGTGPRRAATSPPPECPDT